MVISTPDETRNETAAPKQKASQKTARKRGAKVPSRAAAVSAEERQKMIAAAAYYRAEARGFEPGHEHEDWLVAEREVDALLGR